MSGIFGIFHRDGRPAARHSLVDMRRAMAAWGPDGGAVLLAGSCGLGQLRRHTTAEEVGERLPLMDAVDDAGPAFCFTAAGRVDNRNELLSILGDAEGAEPPADGDLLLRAYRRWGEEAPRRIFGDWAFAAWHPQEQRLFLARDHHGHTALYYHVDSRVLAFASSRAALLALNLAPRVLDECYLAGIVLAEPAGLGARTGDKAIQRLLPAHTLTVTPGQLSCERYWRLEDVAPLQLPRREDYLAAFTELFDEAVRCRLRANGPVAVSLSGGLDSGAVAATAAGLLKVHDQRLHAFTSAPLAETARYVGQRFGDEFPLARRTAAFHDNIDLHKITADFSPIQAIRTMLMIVDEPAHAAGNFFWLGAIRQAARAHGCRVLLTGQMGNAGVSWTGLIGSQSLVFRLQRLGWRGLVRAQVRRMVPEDWRQWYRRRHRSAPHGPRLHALHPDLERRLRQSGELCDGSWAEATSPLAKRCQIIMPGRAHGGFRQAEIGIAHGLDVRDPTADPRLLAFTLAIPDRLYIDPQSGLDRWLIRAAMRDRLPDAVRLNRRRGRQAGDIIPRLRNCAGEVETALAELAAGPAAAYVDVPYLRAVWATVRTTDTPEAFLLCQTVLTRGIMAGLWVNGFAHAP